MPGHLSMKSYACRDVWSNTYGPPCIPLYQPQLIQQRRMWLGPIVTHQCSFPTVHSRTYIRTYEGIAGITSVQAIHDVVTSPVVSHWKDNQPEPVLRKHFLLPTLLQDWAGVFPPTWEFDWRARKSTMSYINPLLQAGMTTKWVPSEQSHLVVDNRVLQ